VCDALLGAEIVLANGQQVSVDAALEAEFLGCVVAMFSANGIQS
jgi:hypothetical protein